MWLTSYQSRIIILKNIIIIIIIIIIIVVSYLEWFHLTREIGSRILSTIMH